jgi:MFS superfamily sulfate permease-like transporter
MDVQKRYTDTNVELKAQGIGNMISALLGGLPMTSVVVRSSANANAGAKTKMSTIIHGVLLLICVLAIPALLNKIPLATLAAVLLMVGYKLAKPATLLHFWHKGKYQFVPFIATLLAVVFTDLLKGVALGMAISIIFVLRGNLKRAYNFRKEEYAEGDVIHIDLAQEVSFLNKAAIKTTLNEIPEHSKIVIDASDTVYIAHDVLDLIKEFKDVKSKEKHLKVKLVGFKEAYELEDTDWGKQNVFVEHKEKKVKKDKKEKTSADAGTL